MIFIFMRKKWKRPLSYVEEHCIVRHVFADWYIVRNLLKNKRGKWWWRFVWFIVNENDFPKSDGTVS